MPEKPALSDREVYDLLHEALMLLSYKTVETPDGHSVLTTAVKQLELLQRALLILTEGDGSDPIKERPR
jgi:hypothetical protein